MANLVETETYDAGVYQLETTDPVQGGPSGVDNLPLKNLANRTNWLKARVDSLLAAIIDFAPINSPVFTGSPKAPTPALNDSSTNIATTAYVRGILSGITTKALTNANVTLTAAEAGAGILFFTGALTANVQVIVPATQRCWLVRNQTTGNFTVTVKTAAGTGYAVTQGRTIELFNDGTNVSPSLTDFVSPAMTGTPTAPTAATGTNTTQVATTAFVKTAVDTLASSAVQKNSDTGAATLPAGSTAQRPTGAAGLIRYNSSIGRFEGYGASAWGSLGGATGGGNDAVFYLNDQIVTTDYTIPSGQNAMSAGPVQVTTGRTVTVPPGSRWTVV